MPELPSGTVTFLFTDIEGSTGGWEQELPAVRSRSRIGHSTGRGRGGSHRQGNLLLLDDQDLQPRHV